MIKPLIILTTAACLALPAQADVIGYWRYESSALLADSQIVDGIQDLVTAGNNSASIAANADRAGTHIYDPISGSTLGNNGSISGTTTNGGNGTSMPAMVRANQAVFKTVNESFTFETFFRVDTGSLVINNGTATIAKQFAGTGDAGANEAGWRTQLRPNVGNPDTFGHVDLIDGNNADDATARVLNTAASLIDGNWHHFAQVYTRSADGTTDTWSTYVDYVHVTTTNFDTSTSDFSRNFNLDLGSTFIAAPSGGGPTQSITWFLDESRYSDSALVADDFLRVVPEPASGLLIALGGLGLLIARRRV